MYFEFARREKNVYRKRLNNSIKSNIKIANLRRLRNVYVLPIARPTRGWVVLVGVMIKYNAYLMDLIKT